jgi:hypothetical protein
MDQLTLGWKEIEQPDSYSLQVTTTAKRKETVDEGIKKLTCIVQEKTHKTDTSSRAHMVILVNELKGILEITG